MSITERVWGALTSMIKLEDKVVRQSEIIKAQQTKIENLTERLIKLETTIELLIRAIGPLVQDHRALRVWLLGDSAERSRFYDQLRYNGWHNLIAMPGAFEDLDEVLRVADLCIIPARAQGLGWLIPKCAASSIPFLTPDSPELRGLVDNENVSQLTFRDGDVENLREKISLWLNTPLPFRQAIARAREQQVSQPLPAWDSLLARCAASFSKI